MIDLATRLPFREAQQALEVQGISLSLSHLERLSQSYGGCFEAMCKERLVALAEAPLKSQGKAKVVVVEADGTFVTERDKPVPGSIEGREVKQLLFYPNNSPSQRESYAAPVGVDDFTPLAHGLMRQHRGEPHPPLVGLLYAGVKQHDCLIGIADGASWLDTLFNSLGVHQRILDVYHAVEYLERVMVFWGWDEADLVGIHRRKFTGTTRRDPKRDPYPDLVERQFTIDEANRVWVADVTQHETDEGWLYLAVIIDIYSRLVVGWSMDEQFTAELVLAALEMALWNRQPQEGIIHHSDHGSQYTSLAFGQGLEQAGVLGSMGSVGDALDNAVAESFFATLQTELLDRYSWPTRQGLRSAMFEFIEVFYNCQRRHSSLAYLSPSEFEERHKAA